MWPFIRVKHHFVRVSGANLNGCTYSDDAMTLEKEGPPEMLFHSGAKAFSSSLLSLYSRLLWHCLLVHMRCSIETHTAARRTMIAVSTMAVIIAEQSTIPLNRASHKNQQKTENNSNKKKMSMERTARTRSIHLECMSTCKLPWQSDVMMEANDNQQKKCQIKIKKYKPKPNGEQ